MFFSLKLGIHFRCCYCCWFTFLLLFVYWFCGCFLFCVERSFFFAQLDASNFGQGHRKFDFLSLSNSLIRFISKISSIYLYFRLRTTTKKLSFFSSIQWEFVEIKAIEIEKRVNRVESYKQMSLDSGLRYISHNICCCYYRRKNTNLHK